jgi:DNA recombination protein RmuC
LQAHFGLAQKDVDMMLTSSEKVLARGVKIESLDFSPSQKEIAHLEAEQLRRIADVRAGTAKLRVVDDE